MRLSIELPDDIGAVVKAKAQAEGLTPDRYVSRVLKDTIEPKVESVRKPLKTGRGILAKYGPAPSAEEIDENRREMFSNFAKGF